MKDNKDLEDIVDKGNILIVEDDESQRNLFNSLLSLEGYSVSEAENGKKALEVIKESNIDLILLDMHMPVMDGYDFCSTLNKEKKDIPVIFISSDSSQEKILKGLEAGALDYIEKPINNKILSAKIRNWIHHKKTEDKCKNIKNQIIQSEKMRAIGQLAGGFAHDFNNMLQGILGYSELMLNNFDKLDDEKKKKSLENIINISKDAAELNKNTLRFARKESYNEEPVDLIDVSREVVKMLKHSIKKNIDIIETYNSEYPIVLGDKSQIQNAILNLAINAKDAMSDGGRLKLSVYKEDAKKEDIPEGKYVCVSMEDNGTGIPDEIKDKIFEPFFTTKEKGKGTGMGLAGVYGSMERHKGYIDVESEQKKGTKITLYFPLTNMGEKTEEKTEEKNLIKGTGNILLVDDEETVRDIGKEMLVNLGYEVMLAKHGAEAVNIYARHKDSIGLIVLDLNMPVMNGEETYKHIKEIDDKAKVVVATGYQTGFGSEKLLKSGVINIIPKPYNYQKLSEIIDDAMRR